MGFEHYVDDCGNTVVKNGATVSSVTYTSPEVPWLTDGERVEIILGMVLQLPPASRVHFAKRLVQEDCNVEKQVMAWLKEAAANAPTLDEAT